MNRIISKKERTNRTEYTSKLLRTAEQRINFLYMLLMVALETSILAYILFNSWDDTRYYFGFRAGITLTAGIIVNAVLRKKSFPWIKYFNNIVMITAIFFLCGFSDLMTLVFILLPFINSFYFRPYFTAVTGFACLFVMYVCFMSICLPLFDGNGNIEYSFIAMLKTAFKFSNETVALIIKNRSFLIVAAVAMVTVSIYLSVSSRRFTIRQGELVQKNIATEMELNLARNIQEGILSSEFPENDSFAVYAEMNTATEVGGDFYDFFMTDETHLAVVIGDVSGHGMAAAMFMTLSKTLIKVYAQAHYSSDKVFELTNRYLLQSNPAKFFVTGWIGILDLSTGILSYTNAGHNFPVVIRGGREPEFLRSKPNFVLGRRRLIRYKENHTRLEPGDKLILYTDGVTEAQAPDESFFGDNGMLGAIGAAAEKNQKEIIVSLRKAVEDFENGSEHYDDATALALSFKAQLHTEPPESKKFFLSKETFDDVTAYIAERCSAAGCDEATVDHIVIASSEILANIDTYVYENGGEIEVMTKCRDRRMTVVFKDNGKPFDPLSAQEPDVTLPLSKRRPGGLGIFIVKKLMSDISYIYENDQNVLTIEIDF